jgi:hypothetical protein
MGLGHFSDVYNKNKKLKQKAGQMKKDVETAQIIADQAK